MEACLLGGGVLGPTLGAVVFQRAPQDLFAACAVVCGVAALVSLAVPSEPSPGICLGETGV